MKPPVLTLALLAAGVRLALTADPALSQPPAPPPATSSEAAEAAPAGTGWLVGQVLAQDGTPVVAAALEVEGTQAFAFTGEDGRFSLEAPAGEHTVTVSSPDHGDHAFAGVRFALNEILTLDLTLGLASSAVERGEDRQLEAVEVEERVVRDSSSEAVTLDRRFSAQVVDSISAEQISRAGDSDIAAALTRVTGLTLLDGKHVYVRGLGERHSSVLLNGAQIPSPDPTRRVVPLDLFPTEMLDSLTVQKSYSADMPGEFSGGTVQIRTRSYPDSLQMRVSASVGYDDSSTGKDGLTYRGGSRDWLGRDHGTREMPQALLSGRLADYSPEQREQLGEALAAQGYHQYERKIDPNGTLALGIGNAFGDEDFRFGFTASARHSHQWDNREEWLRDFSIVDGVIQPVPTQEFQRRRTERQIDSSLYLAAGAEIHQNHKIDTVLMLLRQVTDDVRFDEGYYNSPNDIEHVYQLEWLENELMVKQFTGEHGFPAWGGLTLDWQYTRSDASRFEPNTRRYRYTQRPGQQEFGLLRGSAGNRQIAAQLDDQGEDAHVGLTLPLSFGEDWFVELNGGVGRVERERDSWIRRYNFRLGNSPLLTGLNDIEEIFSPIYISTDPSLVNLIDAFQATDTYMAEQNLRARYLSADIAYGDRFRLNLGVRRESNDQVVTTYQPFNPVATPVIGAIRETDNLPAATFTWSYSENAQFRLGFSQTLSRPDFRELTQAEFTDPVTDTTTRGNPNLRQSKVDNYDARWEYYFSNSESISVALFLKEFTDPIEIVRVPGTGELLEPQNAKEARNYGFEIDYYKGLSGLRDVGWVDRGWLGRIPWENVYLGFNYARIWSEVTLGEEIIGIQSTDDRPLQGQSPYVFNFQLGYRDAEGRREATLLYNVFGERIINVGVRTLPDVYEQPLHQVDFVYSHRFNDNWRARVRLRNLLGESVEFTQGGHPTRVYDKGRDITLYVDWTW